MASISGCAKADEADLVGQLTSVIGVGDEEDTVAKLIEWPRPKGSRVEYPTGSSRFKEFCKAKSSIDGIWGHAFAYRGNFFRTCIFSQGGDYLYLLPDLAKEMKCRRLGDEVSLEYVQGIVKDSQTDGLCCYLAQFDYGLTLPFSNLAKSVMNLIGACPAQLNCNFWEVILVYETLNERWAASCSERRITAKDFLEYYVVKYRSDEEPQELNNRTITKGINCKVSRKESFINIVAREGTELKAAFKELEISRFKRVASKDYKVRRSQAKRRLAGKTPGSMEEKLSTPELNTPLNLAQLNKILDGPVDMATISSTVVRNLVKRNAIKRRAISHSVSSEVLEESDMIAEGADLRPRFEVEAGLLEEQYRAKTQENMVAIMDDEFKKFARALRDAQLGFQDRSMELEKRISQLEGDKNQLEENLTRERGAFQLEWEKEREATALKLKEVKAKREAKAERLVTASAISRNNLARKLYQLRYTKEEIMAFSEGNYEEMEIMDGEDLALNQLTSELAELKEKAVSGSRHEAELAEYCVKALNEEIFNMKCNLRTLNEQLLMREIELDTARTNLAASETNFEKLSSSIMGKDRELRNSAQIRDSLIARLDCVKADLRRLNGREAQSRADVAEIQAKNKSLVDDLSHAHGNVRRVVKREKEMNEIINQLCARISKSKRELRVREMKYQKDLKFEFDKRDGKIASGEGSREMKEFLRQKEELVENMRIDLTNSWHKSIDLTRQMSERIDQLTAELAELKAHCLKDNKRAAVTHQAFKELAVHEQEKCDGEALHQRKLSALVAFFAVEIKFLQVERDLMQDCFSGRTYVCKLVISSIDPIGVMDRGIGTTTPEQIARGREIVVERAPEYMASMTEIGGSSSVVSPIPIMGGRSNAFPLRKSCRVKKK
ncbi:hypothetical protein GIB67_021253 [Kingdonia uniflora]|uniref:Uncharacterized protein n=1 Tax=Kingdonia uniflora TaxID=39325 RepID=A0A7J7LFM5_9MAGN|nr:hypothetical protein GIB67_021253 [Kingdonia uniflora]